ncbi:MAG: alpha/beta fold hydrolase [Phototrophicales bacterium]|nr:alpha/beta fold hydrolase [Phototrophicales bacterium]
MVSALPPSLQKGGEPFFHRGNDIGVLCLHGITASPDEMRWLGHYLHTHHGYTVYGARHVGHAVDYRHMHRTRWEDWYLTGIDGYHLLRSQCKKIFVAGLSMGGLITLLISASLDLDGIVVIAAPIDIPSKVLPYAKYLQWVMPSYDTPDTSDFPARLLAEQHRRGLPTVGRVRYKRWATRGVAELYELMEVVRGRLPLIQTPALLMYSEGDKSVPINNMSYIEKHIGSDDVQVRKFEKSGHILTQDVDCDAVFQTAGAFIQERS